MITKVCRKAQGPHKEIAIDISKSFPSIDGVDIWCGHALVASPRSDKLMAGALPVLMVMWSGVETGIQLSPPPDQLMAGASAHGRGLTNIDGNKIWCEHRLLACPLPEKLMPGASPMLMVMSLG